MPSRGTRPHYCPPGDDGCSLVARLERSDDHESASQAEKYLPMPHEYFDVCFSIHSSFSVELRHSIHEEAIALHLLVKLFVGNGRLYPIGRGYEN